MSYIVFGCMEHTLAGLKKVSRSRAKKNTLPLHLIVGKDGEDAAYFYLSRKGYSVVARRWSSGEIPGDLDLIAWDGPMLCFVEVKTRTAHDNTPAEVAVDSHKRNTLRRLARQYVRRLSHETRPAVRFDVLSVYLIPGKKKEFVHFEGAFEWKERRLEFASHS